MPLTITHPFVSTIPDSAAAIILGKVIPSQWNAAHSVSGNLGANEITNIPAGTISATNVQAAINELASSIPAPGPGTDPLFLVNGFQLNTVNPTWSGDPNRSVGARIKVAGTTSEINPSFSNYEGLAVEMIVSHGQAVNGGVTQAKQTLIPLNLSAIYNASGQKFLENGALFSYGMSDSSWGQRYVQYSGGPVNGDEGQGFRLVCPLQQQNYLNLTQIQSKPTQSVVNTTTTQAIVASKDAQTVTVVSTAGAVNGDWVVIQQEVANGAPNLEAVQIISFSPTSITGIFRQNHPNPVTVTPALVIQCFSTFQMGQDRVLVNLTAPSYSTGTCTAITGGGMDFSGIAVLNPPNGPVGGNATNIGVISLNADTYTGTPFNGAVGTVNGPLRSWYQITEITTNTHLAIHSFSVAGDGSYHGRGPGPSGTGAGGTGAYIIRPSAKVLRVDAVGGNATGFLICETVANPALWQVGDDVEQAICPYADISGFQYRINHYTPGGAGVRCFMFLENWGSRTWESGIDMRAGPGGGVYDPTGDGIAFGTGMSIADANVGISLRFNQKAAIKLATGDAGHPHDNDPGNAIMWGTLPVAPNLWPLLGFGIGYNSPNSGLTITGTDNFGRLDFIKNNVTGAASSVISELRYNGCVRLSNTSATRPFIWIDFNRDILGTNWDHSFLRWDIPGNRFEIGTESGQGNVFEMGFLTGNVERTRVSTYGIRGMPCLSTTPVAFGSLPAGQEGLIATITDSTVNTWGTVIAGGGANRVLGYHNGSNWTVIGV